MTQDFSRKMVVVLRDDLASWQLTNTVGHITAYLGNKMSEPFDTGKYFISKDGINFPRNSQFAVIALRANKEELRNLVTKVRNSNFPWIAYVQEMIDMIDDAELAKAFGAKESSEVEILGIGMFGPKEELKPFTDRLKLWK